MFKKYEEGDFLQQTLQNGTKRRYLKGRVLGKGGFAKCYQIIDEASKNKYACKIIEKQMLSHKKLKEKLQSQILIHKQVHHQNIVKFQHVFEDQQYIYILLELCINNTLNELLIRRKQLTEVEVRYYVYYVLLAISYLHNDHIIHRDIKLDNFFLSEQLEIKIGDFGLATTIQKQNKKKSICGTPIYIAPQIVDGKSGYSYEIDVWSLGIVTFLLLYGRFPFDGGDIKEISSKIKAKSYLVSSYVSEFAKSFISKMLQINPADRFTAKQLLKHQFLSDYEIPKLLPRSSLACPPNSNFLDQYKNKKNKIIFKKNSQQEEEFHFMLCSKQSTMQESQKIFASQEFTPDMLIVIQDNKQNLIGSNSVKKIVSYVNHDLQDKKQNINVKTWIMEWWQSPKYGLIYKTSDGVIGVRFNDATNMISQRQNSNFIYFSQNCKQINYDLRMLTKSQIPDQVYLKMKIMIKLRNQRNLNDEIGQQLKVYVKKYFNCLNIFIIWLSNGLLQAQFSNGNILILSSKNCLHITKDKTKTVFNIIDLKQQSQQIKNQQQQLQKQIKRILTLRAKKVNQSNPRSDKYNRISFDYK